MVRYLPLLLELALLLYALVDSVQTESRQVRNLPKLVWVMLIVLVPIVGPLAWLLVGRPRRESAESAESAGSAESARPTGASWPLRPMPSRPTSSRPPQRRPLAPDDDPEFLARLKRSNTEHEDLLKKWEDDLRRREDELKRQPGDPDSPDAGPRS